MRKLGVPPKAKDIVAESPPVNNWLEIVGELLQKYQQGPMFSAYQSVAQSVPNSSFTVLSCEVEEVDTSNAYSTSNYRFAPTVAGYYQIQGAVQWSNPVTNYTTISVFKNGAEHRRGNGANSSVYNASVAALVYLNGSTDYVELKVWQASGGSLLTTAGATSTYFQGYLVRPV